MSRPSGGRTSDLIRRFESLAQAKNNGESDTTQTPRKPVKPAKPPLLTKYLSVSADGIQQQQQQQPQQQEADMFHGSAAASIEPDTLPVPSELPLFPELKTMPPLVSNTSQDTALREAIAPQTISVRKSDEPQSKAQSLEYIVVPMAPSNLPLADHDISNSNRSNSASLVQDPVATGEPKPRRKSLGITLNQQANIDSPVSASFTACLKSAERYMDEAHLHQESGDLENAHLKYQLSSNTIEQLPRLHEFETISESATYDGVRSESDTLMLDDLKRLTEALKTHQYVDPRGDSVPDTRVDAVEQLDMMESGFAQMYPDHQLSHSESNTASSSPMHQRSQLVVDTEDSAIGTSQTLTSESQWMATQQSKFEEIDAQARIIDAEARRITSRSPGSRSNTIPGIAVISHGMPPILPAMAISPDFETTDKGVSSEFINATASTCMALELWNLLDKSRTAADGHPTVLILDVRPHQDFVWGQIDHKYTVNIEPAALHKGCTSADIESSLVLVSDDQQAWFHQRGDFDIVVYTSQSAHLFSDGGSMEIAAMEALNSAIYHCEFLKPLKHQPLFLIGGFDSWVQKMGKHQCLWSDEARRSMARSPFPESVQTWSASSEPVTLSVGVGRTSNTSLRTERLSTLAFHAPTGSPSDSTILSYQTLYQAVAVSSPVPPVLQIPALVSSNSVAALVVASSMDDATVSTPVSGSVFDFFQQSNNYNPQWQQQQQQQMDCQRQAAYTLSTQGYNAMSTHAATAPAPASEGREELSDSLPTFNATSDRLSAAPVDPAADNSQIPDEAPAPLPEVPDNTTNLNQRSTVFDNPTYGFTGPAYSGRTNVNEYTAVSVPTDIHFATAEANHAENEEQQQQQMIAEPAKKRRQPPPIPTLRLPPKPEACVQQATLQNQTQQHPQLASHVPNAPLPLKPLEYVNSPPANQQYQYQQYQYQQYQQQQHNQQQQQYAQMQSAAANGRGFYNYPVAAGSDPSLNGRMHAGGNLRNSFAYNQAGKFAIALPAEPNYNSAPRIDSRVPAQAQVQPPAALYSSAIGMTGLKNFGNTCFMNCVIQCLVGTVPFARYFLQGGWKKDLVRGSKSSYSDVVVEFSRLIENMWCGQYGSLSPIGFRSAVGNCSAQFKGNDQEDAQEFALFVLDTLHESLNRVHPHPPPDSDMTPDEEIQFEHLPDFQQANIQWERYICRNWSIMTSIFQGQVQSRLTCLLCKHTSTTYFTFTELSVPIPTPEAKPSSAAVLLRKSSSKNSAPVSIYQCLDAFSGSEILDGDNKWHCPRCKTRRKASKRMLISRLPLVLIVHLKRFSTIGHFREKLETNVVFPTRQLQMDNYMMPDARQQSTTSYNLYAVVNHYGTLSSGHYTASVFNGLRGQWNYFDDTRVAPVPEDKVASPAAYMLFYVRNQ